MSISAKVVLASSYEGGKPIYSVQTSSPKWMLAELNTHRAFSRSSGSSRAVPIQTVVERIKANPYMPKTWGRAQPGMQSKEELEPALAHRAKVEWLRARDNAVDTALAMCDLGLHKQYANRILEPFMFIDTIITATEWDNFFHLRCHPDAQPEMQELACAIRDAINSAEVNELKRGEWHMPYVLPSEFDEFTTRECLMFSVARCARVSYLLHDGSTPDQEKDIALYKRLVGSEPLHASPAEHQACYDPLYPRALGYHRNFVGWVQLRALIEEDIKHEKLLGYE